MQNPLNNWPAPNPNKEEMDRLRREARHATWHATKKIVKWTLIGAGAYAIVKAAQNNNEAKTEI